MSDFPHRCDSISAWRQGSVHNKARVPRGGESVAVGGGVSLHSQDAESPEC